jgi:chromate transporter
MEKMGKSISLLDITGVILLSSLFSFGGGNGPLAVMQGKWVEPGFLDPALFAWVIAISYLTPGPKAGFLSGIGYYMGGIWGAFAAIIGIIIPTCLGAAAVGFGMNRIKPIIKMISLPAGFVISGMIVAAAWSMAGPMNLNLIEVGALIFVIYLVGWKDVDAVWLILGALGIGTMWWFIASF